MAEARRRVPSEWQKLSNAATEDPTKGRRPSYINYDANATCLAGETMGRMTVALCGKDSAIGPTANLNKTELLAVLKE